MGNLIKKQHLGVIDIGSNAIRMAIALLDENGQVRILHRWRTRLRLGKDVFRSKKILEESSERLLRIIQRFSQDIQKYPETKLEAVATSAMRDATNREEIQNRVYHETGVHIDVLTGKQEAKYLFDAIQFLVPLKEKNIVVADLGGGSLEVSLIHDHTLIYQKSLDYGTLRMLSSKDDEKDIRNRLKPLAKKLSTSPRDFSQGSSHLLLTGGNAKVLGQIVSKSVSPHLINSSSQIQISWNEFLQISKKIQKETLRERMEHWQLHQQQAEVLIPAINIFQVVGQSLNSFKISFPQISLKEAIILHLACSFINPSSISFKPTDSPITEI